MKTKTPERFTLQGVTYYQEFRRCGAAGCQCRTGGQLHGPYWYKRCDGRARYVGRELPEDVTAARRALAQAEKKIWAKIEVLRGSARKLSEQAAALERLVRRAALSEADVRIAVEMGFGGALARAEVGR